jgi:hypothetical protein
MKKGTALLFSILFLSMFLVSFVSAATFVETTNGFIDGTIQFFKETKLIPALIGDTPSGDLLFAKFLFFVIIFSLVWVALSQVDFFNEYNWVLVLITIAVSILSTRWIATEGLVRNILLPYTTLGIALSAALPFAIYFIFVNILLKDSKYKTVRKIAWLFFMVIFIGLWFVRQDQDQLGTSAKWIYPITILASFLVLAFDGTISSILAKIDLDKSTDTHKLALITELKRKIAQAQTDFTAGLITQSQHDRLIRDYQKKIFKLSK